MQPKTVMIGAIAMLALAGCDVPAAQVPQGDECGAKAYQGLIGQPATVARWDDARTVRVIGHDSAVTMDFMPTRMNIWVGADGLVEKVSCG